MPKETSVQVFKTTVSDTFVGNVQQHLKREFENNLPIIEKISGLLPLETANATEDPNFADLLKSLLKSYSDDLGENDKLNADHQNWK